MLFNSPAFLFGFLPLVLAVAAVLRQRVGTRAVIGWLLLASLVFYGLGSPQHLPLLLASMWINFALARQIASCTAPWRLRWLWAAIALNVGALLVFKYTEFLVAMGNASLGTHWLAPDIVLPIGISFYTFTQLAFLVDVYRHEASTYAAGRFGLFVSYFPHLVAGPILHHRQVIPQLADERLARMDRIDVARGAALFAFGLAKKVLVADALAPFADPVFAAADEGRLLTLWEAWLGLLAYTFQLYFDFSGYSDMALGLSLLLGVQIPVNFRSPYQATSIIDFWRRWHITLSDFLRRYVYIPLGGNRLGIARRYLNLLLTMLLGGLWHGAGWGFVVWGGLHGVYLAANHSWRHLRQRAMPVAPSFAARLAAGALTFIAVVLAWSFFRATTLSGAVNLIIAAVGGNGIALPQSLAGGPLQPSLGAVPAWLTFGGMFINDLTEEKVRGVFTVAAAAAVAWIAPRAVDLCRADDRETTESAPSASVMIGAGALLAISVMQLHREAPFLYFQF